MDCFSYNDIQNLAKLVGADKESNEDLGNMNYYNNSLTGSVLTPNTIANPTNKKNDKELARPYTKIEAKYNNRLTNNNNNDNNNNNKDKNTDKVHKSEYSDKNINSQIKKENNIWDIDELDNNEKIIEDGRVKPELDIMYRQVVGAEDVYLGMNGVENSSTACSMLSIKIHLPKTHLKEITFEVKNQSIHLNTPLYVLNENIEYPVNKDKSTAKWDKDKQILYITLPIIKKSLFDALSEVDT